jgi:hypothetical protein
MAAEWRGLSQEQQAPF